MDSVSRAFLLCRVRETGGMGEVGCDGLVMYPCKFLHSVSVGCKRCQHAFHPINIYQMEQERNRTGEKSKKKEMKWWGFCWKSPRERTLLVCHARVGRVPVITVYAQQRSERDEPATDRWLQSSGGAEFHTLFSHTWSGIIQNKLDGALWCQLRNQTLDVLLKIITASIVLLEHLPPFLPTIRTHGLILINISGDWLWMDTEMPNS